MKPWVETLWLVHDGNISNRNQVRSLASGIGKVAGFGRIVEVDVSVQRQQKQQCGPLLTNEDAIRLAIGCGRRSASLVASLKRDSTAKAVQILHPRLPFTTTSFDCLVLPKHDAAGWFDDESKIVRMNGSLSWGLRKDALICNRKRFEHWNKINPDAIQIAFLLGGSAISERAFAEVQALCNRSDVRVHVVGSRRTPIESYSPMIGLRPLLASFWTSQSTLRNPYRTLLGLCDAFVVSEDSISMVSDALTVQSERRLQAPIFLLEASETMRSKHARFLELVKQGHAEQNVRRFITAEDLVYAVRSGSHVQARTYEADEVGSQVAKVLGLC